MQGTTKPSGATTVAAKSEAIANAAGEAFDLKKRRALEQLDAKYLCDLHRKACYVLPGGFHVPLTDGNLAECVGLCCLFWYGHWYKQIQIDTNKYLGCCCSLFTALLSF